MHGRRTIDSDESNNDDEDTLPWSPLPDLMYKEISSGNDVITSTVPWIDVIPRNNPNMTNSMDERSLFGSESEKEGDSTDVRIQFKTAYVAIKKLKLPGLRFPMKTSKKKRKRKVKPKAKWVINPTSKDFGLDSNSCKACKKSANKDSTGQDSTIIRRSR